MEKDELGRLRHTKYIPNIKQVECYTCGTNYIPPLYRLRDNENSKTDIYFCKIHDNK